DSFPAEIEGRVEPDRHAVVLLYEASVSLDRPRAAARGDDAGPIFFEQRAKHLGLRLPKNFLAALRDEIVDASLLLFGDDFVEVNHLTTQQARERTRHAGLARGHEARDDDATLRTFHLSPRTGRDRPGPFGLLNSPPATSSSLRQRFEQREEFREGYGDALLRALYLAVAFGGERGDGEAHRDAVVAERLQARAAQTRGAVDAQAVFELFDVRVHRAQVLGDGSDSV